MSTISLAIQLLAPSGSRRGKKLRDSIAKVRKHRVTSLMKARHNTNRINYYSHAITKQPKDQTMKISIVVPCYNTPKKYFEPLLASVFAQGYENWELILVDASDSAAATKYLHDRAQADTRINYLRTTNEGIALNTNKGISKAAGELVAFLDHDDMLDQDALAESAEMFTKDQSIELVYSDEDKISDDGEQYFEPHFKPDFSLDMLRNVNYITHFVVVKKGLVDELGGIREGFDGAQDYDFLLRAVDTGVKIGHVPKILYHWRQAEGSTAADFSNKKHVTEAGCRALKDHYKRRKITGVTPYAIENRPGFYRAEYHLNDARRQIIVDFSEVQLSQLEKEYILEHYRANKDVIKYHMEVLEDKLPNERNSNQLLVNGAFIPAHETTDIASLFGLASETGVSGVSPKIVRAGKVFDSGIVKTDRVTKYLFRGANPERPTGFGSLEWVRNVDELTGNVGVYGESKDTSRQIIWSHSEFVAFSSASMKETVLAHNYYNPNLTEYVEVVEEPQDYLADLIEIKK